ncbi:MAG: CDP-diacylglycerol--serine O-phosphatidyltransferase [Deltaproteobacteria bacterium]|nr:CDP-diacylglycerol--serine O-phosphatidyltransferase [Deltaproteobacteria bacterium]MBW2661414.1 CDP-diacylglycerol--serine O-phosphatidyltransferase [Deltaproteobacteria bacterium]
MKSKRFEKKRLSRGIFILPNIFTSLNLFCGFYAIIASIDGKYVAGAIAIIIAVIFDMLDGKIARATNTTSKFGMEYDSLADLISFGLAPGLMVYLWALRPLGRIGWLAAFLFMACGALRLARFNTKAGSSSSNYFIGLPIPGGAGMAAATVLFCHRLNISESINPVIILLMLYALAFLMVSTINYKSFKKNPEPFQKINFNVLVTAILIMIFIAAQPSITMFFLGCVYIVSGPFITIRLYHKDIKQKKVESLESERHNSNTI